MTFTSYEKIPESPQHWGLDERGFRALTKVRWVVTEKIHGANFCFVVHNGTVRCANRREFLSPGDPFYGYQRVLARLRSQVLEAAALASRGSKSSTVSIYGELFDGAASCRAGRTPPPAIPNRAGDTAPLCPDRGESAASAEITRGKIGPDLSSFSHSRAIHRPASIHEARCRGLSIRSTLYNFNLTSHGLSTLGHCPIRHLHAGRPLNLVGKGVGDALAKDVEHGQAGLKAI
jgi:hypothetical protein